MRVTHRVEVDRKAIASLFGQYGAGGRWIRALAFDMKVLAAGMSPQRSTELARSHKVTFERGANQFRATAVVWNTAEHAEYVHEGRPSIRVSGKKRMILPPGGPSVINSTSKHAGKRFPKKALKKVAAQAPNPWLDNACSVIARAQGAVGG